MTALNPRVSGGRRDLLLAGPLLAIWVAFFAFGCAVLQPWRPEMPLSNDFVAFWTGAVFLREGAGASLFDTSVQASFQADLRLGLTGTAAMRTGDVLNPFHSPPVQGLMLVPLTVLPLQAAYLVFSVGSLLAIVCAIALPLRRHPWGATAAVVMLSFAAVTDTLVFGQVNAQFVLGLSLALMAFRSGRPFLGGMLLGVLWLKPQYALLFPLVFLLKRRWRELGGMVATGAILALVSVGLVGIDGALRYVEMVRGIGGFYAPPNEFIFPQSMVNWRAVITHLLPGISEEGGRLLMFALAAATYGVSLLAWRGPWEPSSPRFGCQVLVLLIATVLASPHSNFHGMVLLLPPLAWVVAASAGNQPGRRIGEMLAFAVYLSALVVWPAKENSWLLVPLLIGAMVAAIPLAPGAPSIGSPSTERD